MSVYVMHMDKPKNCTGCDLNDGIYCSVIKGDSYVKDMCVMGELRHDCPVLFVPPHGKLIDADAFLQKLYDYAITPEEIEFCKKVGYALSKERVVIPADME